MKQDPPRQTPAGARAARAPVRPHAAPAPAPRMAHRRAVPEKVRGREDAAALRERAEASERLVGALRAELAAMKELMERMGSLNHELELQNREYERELAAAEARIRTLENSSSFSQEKPFKDGSVNSDFQDSGSKSKLMLEESNLGVHPAVPVSRSPKKTSENSIPPPPPPLVVTSPRCCVSARHPPPPPPPPPPLRVCHPRTVAMQRAPSLVQFYHSLTKREREKIHSSSVGSGGAVDSKAHTSIVGEIQNRSAHLLAIKADVETKGDFINFLINTVQSVSYTDIKDLSSFVDWLDNKLSTLADERAVLKHFNWPEKKADAMREAAMEYRALKRLENEVHLFQDDPCMSFEFALKKMVTLLEKLERGIERLTKLRDIVIHIYKEAKIPTEWMLDTGVVSKVKLSSVKLAKVCMRRVSTELESFRHCGRGTVQEGLLLQCIRFAYRVHQFAGGLDMEAMSVFEELRQRVSCPDRGSHELLPRIEVL